MFFINPVQISDGTSDGKRTSTNATDEAISAYNPATTYALNAQVKYLHGIFESRIADNTGNAPVAATTSDKWRYLGPLNSWAMFDQTVETQTVNEDTIETRLTLAAGATSIAFLNCEAKSIRVKMTDPVEGVVYDRTISMTSTLGITNFWRWLRYPIQRKRDVVFLDLPTYYSAYIDITIDNTGGDAKCGVCSVGLLYQIGQADYGTSFGIVDFSRVREDEFGNRVIIKRSFAKKMSVPITLDRLVVDYVTKTLQDFRQLPVVWIASEHYEATIIFGPYESFETIIVMWGQSRMQLVIKGLI